VIPDLLLQIPSDNVIYIWFRTLFGDCLDGIDAQTLAVSPSTRPCLWYDMDNFGLVAEELPRLSHCPSHIAIL
jgi:hypothetical protein